MTVDYLFKRLMGQCFKNNAEERDFKLSTLEEMKKTSCGTGKDAKRLGSNDASALFWP